MFILQVYIVAVEREHEKETKPPREEDDYGESSRESLLSLVQPELPTLSQNWLGALRDYAYLSLPTGTDHSFIMLYLHCLVSLSVITLQINFVLYCTINSSNVLLGCKLGLHD